MEPSR